MTCPLYKAHCDTCLTDEGWKAGVMSAINWHGVCPYKYTAQTIPPRIKIPSPVKMIEGEEDLSKYDLEKEKGVFERMKTRNHSPCEMKRQEKLIARLEEMEMG